MTEPVLSVPRAELDRIAAEVACGPAPGYPRARLYWNTPGVCWHDGNLHVPDGPWRVPPGHRNRAGAPPGALDPDDPARIRASDRARWRAAGRVLTCEGLPVHPDAEALLRDPRIGLPTGLGSWWRWDENRTVDLVILREDGSVLTIIRGDGSIALPGGFVNQGESIEAAARREVDEETGVDERIGGRAVVLDERRPTGPQATLNAWSHNTVIYLADIDEAYAADVHPVGADDARAGAAWIPADQALRHGMYSTHAQYLRMALDLRHTGSAP